VLITEGEHRDRRLQTQRGERAVADVKYDYYRHDGAYFRAAPGKGMDVQAGEGWKPYEGDVAEPKYFGSKVEQEEVEAAGIRQARRIASRARRLAANPRDKERGESSEGR
jgi:hypothetical protein